MKKKITPFSLFLLLILVINSCSKDADNLSFQTGEIQRISPTTGPGDTEVTIDITGLSTTINLENLRVFFNEQPASITNATATEITAIVPRGAMTGSVRVVANGQEITGPEFTYIITLGQVTTLTGSGTGTSNTLEGPINEVIFATSGMNISQDASGNLYTSEFGGYRIRKIDTDLMVTTLVDKGRPAQAVFSNSNTVVSNGNLISCNYIDHTIEKISLSDGRTSILAGTGTQGNINGAGSIAQFSNPIGIGIDSNDNIYISDTFNHSIRKISPSNEVTTTAGTGERGFINGSASIAQFFAPRGLVIGPDDSVFVVDTGNHSIRKISADGTVTTFAGTGVAGFSDGLVES